MFTYLIQYGRPSAYGAGRRSWAMTWDTVELDTEDGVTTITVDRPDRLNALNVATLEALDEALDEAEERDTRALIVTGAGDDAFVAGADLAYMKDLGVQEAQEYSELGHRVMTKAETFPVPVIAAINGYAFGGGCELALAADMRVASERAVIGQVEVSVGIMPGWGGIQRLARLVDDEVARRLVYFAERIDAEDADQYGLVGDVVAHDQLDDHVADLAAGLDYEQRLWSGLFDTADQEEGMAAFVEDREPEWES